MSEHLAWRAGAVIPPALLLAAFLSAMAAGAQEPGRFLFGTRDFEMDWRAEAGGRPMRLRFLGARRLLRMEPLDGSDQVMLRDLATGTVHVLIGEGRGGVHAGRAPPLGPFRPDGIGEIRTIAGEACREMRAGPERFCLTDDGIPLEMANAREHYVAERLLRRAQAPALFEVPKEPKPKPIPGLPGLEPKSGP
jgi:hypothetical protein